MLLGFQRAHQVSHPLGLRFGLAFQLRCLLALALVFPVPGKDLLLLGDQLGGADRLGGHSLIVGQLLGVFFLLVGDLPDGMAPVVQLGLLALQRHELVAHPDDLQQSAGLLLAAGLHELGQVQGKLLHKGVQQLLARLVAHGVGDLQAGILAAAFHRD